jgi:hypothetical protein
MNRRVTRVLNPILAKCTSPVTSRGNGAAVLEHFGVQGLIGPLRNKARIEFRANTTELVRRETGVKANPCGASLSTFGVIATTRSFLPSTCQNYRVP